MSRGRTGWGLPVLLFVLGTVNIAAGIDSLVVGTVSLANRRWRWDRLRVDSRRLNVATDSVWKWNVEAHTNIAPGLGDESPSSAAANITRVPTAPACKAGCCPFRARPTSARR